MELQIKELIKESEKRSAFFMQQAEVFHNKAVAEGVQIQILSDKLKALETSRELKEFDEEMQSASKQVNSN